MGHESEWLRSVTLKGFIENILIPVVEQCSRVRSTFDMPILMCSVLISVQHQLLGQDTANSRWRQRNLPANAIVTASPSFGPCSASGSSLYSSTDLNIMVTSTRNAGAKSAAQRNSKAGPCYETINLPLNCYG